MWLPLFFACTFMYLLVAFYLCLIVNNVICVFISHMIHITNLFDLASSFNYVMSLNMKSVLWSRQPRLFWPCHVAKYISHLILWNGERTKNKWIVNRSPTFQVTNLPYRKCNIFTPLSNEEFSLALFYYQEDISKLVKCYPLHITFI